MNAVSDVRTGPLARRSCWIASGAVLLTLWGCTGSKAQVRDVKVAAPEVEAPTKKKDAPANAPDEPNVPQINSKAKLLFEDALKAYDAQKRARTFDYPRLEKKFQDALGADGKLAEAEYNLGVLAERQGKIDEAVSRYKGALARKPTLRQAAENLAVIAQNRGDIPGAVAIYQDILTKYPDDASSRAHLAEIFRQSGDHDKAMEFARQALIREPKTLLAYKVMMLSYLDRKQFSMAKLVALRAMKIDENDPELYFTVGLILMRQDDTPKARLQFKRALEVRPDFLPAHLEMARLALKDENFPMAEQHLRKLLQANGKNAEAHLNLGVAYKGMGQYDKAMQEYDAAEKLDAKLSGIYLNRAIILHRHKDAPDRAIELYKRYMEMAQPPADSPAFALLKEAEQLVQAKEEMKKQEEEMKKQQELQEQQKKLEEKNKGAAVAADAKGDPNVQPAKGTAPAPAPKGAQTAPPAPPPPPPPAAVPAKKVKPESDEPADEPSDAM
jgi:tetratricopeptide (TPR) repeat protein